MSQYNQHQHNNQSGMNPGARENFAQLRRLLEFKGNVGKSFGIPQVIVQQVQSHAKQNIIEHQ
ncbi:hypothetical protein D3C85_1844420 [compost metagenome]